MPKPRRTRKPPPELEEIKRQIAAIEREAAESKIRTEEILTRLDRSIQRLIAAAR